MEEEIEVQYVTSPSTNSLETIINEDALKTADAKEEEVKSCYGNGDVGPNPYRWLILGLYSLTAFANTLVWLSLFTVSDATVAYYRITETKLLWSSIAFTAMQVVVAVPASFLPSRIGLRTTMVLGAVFNALGASVLIASTHRSGFPYFVVGQTIIALGSAILPQLAPEVSAVWFGEKEQALSTSIGIIIGNAGAAVGFLQPALMISNIEPLKHIDYVDEKMKQLIYSQAALCILLLFLVIVFFKKVPKVPPSVSQLMRTDCGSTFAHFKNVYKTLFKDKNYIFCGNSFALNQLLLITVPLLLNGIVSWKFPFQDGTIGWMGFGGIIGGIVGSVVFAIVLDKTKAYKRMAILLGFSSLVLWIAFTETLAQFHDIALIAALFVGCLFTFIPFGPIVVDMIVESTYPISESMSFVVPITAGRLYSVPVVLFLGYLVDRKDFHTVCLTIAGIIALSIMLMFFPKVATKRSDAGKLTIDPL